MTPRDPISLGLPHRTPFIFIEEVVELVPGEAAKGYKIFLPEEPFFAGHFPGDPIVPAVILTEALAQTAGIAGGGTGRTFRLSAIKGMKFFRAVRPAERIELSARKLGSVGDLWQFEVAASVDDQRVAEGVIILNAA